MKLCLIIILLALYPTFLCAADPDEEEWFEEESSTSGVNEGELTFLASPIDPQTLHLENRITIDDESLTSGWVDLRQCYYNLDPVEKVEVVYRYREIRDLSILSTDKIRKATVEDKAVQLEGVEKKASLCVKAKTKNFYAEASGFTLRNGPFLRRFLDGYYPFRVSMIVDYPQKAIRLVSVLPEAQQGLLVERRPGTLLIDAWFEGKLSTEIRFQLKTLSTSLYNRHPERLAKTN